MTINTFTCKKEYAKIIINVSVWYLILDTTGPRTLIRKGEGSRRGALTTEYIARVFKLASRTGSVLETTLSPSTRLEIDATDAAVTTVEVGRPCMQEVQGGPQAPPYPSENLCPSSPCKTTYIFACILLTIKKINTWNNREHS